MEGERGGHSIGEPVTYIPRPGEAPLKEYPPGEIVREMKRTMIRRIGLRSGIMMMVFLLFFLAMIFPLTAMEMMTGATAVQAMAPFLMATGVLCFSFMIAIPIASITIYLTVKNAAAKMERMRVWMYKDRLTICSVQSHTAPETVVHIPYHLISDIAPTSKGYWNGLMKGTPSWFKFVNRRPWQPPECMFSFFSDPQDLITIEIRSPIMVSKMLWPRRIIEIACMGQYPIDRAVIDIDRRRHGEFLKDVAGMTGSARQ